MATDAIITTNIIDGAAIGTNVENGANITSSFVEGTSVTSNLEAGAKGDKGDSGYTPIKGVDYFDGISPTVTVGSTTTGAAGSSAAVSSSGTPEAVILDFTIPKGDTGEAASISIGTTTTGSAGDSASVSNSGSSSAAVLNFTVPQGVKGDTGATNSLSIGTVTTGAAGSSASSTITGTAPNQTLNLTIPRGNTGATGTAATITVGTTTTLAAGSSATVQNVGTSSAAIFNFGVPKGADGTGTGDMSKSVYDPTLKATDVFNQDNMTSGTTNKNYTTTEQTKLSGIESGAQVNTVTSVANKTGDVTIGVTDLTATGTPSSSKYLRGDNTWNTPTNTTYSEITTAEITTGTATTLRTITGRRAQDILNNTLQSVYPIGSVYQCTSSTMPVSIASVGTWIPITTATSNGSTSMQIRGIVSFSVTPTITATPIYQWMRTA